MYEIVLEVLVLRSHVICNMSCLHQVLTSHARRNRMSISRQDNHILVFVLHGAAKVMRVFKHNIAHTETLCNKKKRSRKDTEKKANQGMATYWSGSSTKTLLSLMRCQSLRESVDHSGERSQRHQADYLQEGMVTLLQGSDSHHCHSQQ